MTLRRGAAGVVVVAVAGVAGAAVRWAGASVFEPRAALLAANVVGCALAGWAATRQRRRRHRSRSLPGAWLTAGWCGSLTSFSAIALQLAGDLDAGRVGTAALWLGLTLAGCAAAFVLAGRAVSVGGKAAVGEATGAGTTP